MEQESGVATAGTLLPLSEQEQRYYSGLHSLCQADTSGKLSSAKVAELLKASQLPPETLHKVSSTRPRRLVASVHRVRREPLVVLVVVVELVVLVCSSTTGDGECENVSLSALTLVCVCVCDGIQRGSLLFFILLSHRRAVGGCGGGFKCPLLNRGPSVGVNFWCPHHFWHV